MVPIVIMARKNPNSPRCPNKLVRTFYQDLSLIEVFLNKFKNRKDVYLASYDQDFKILSEKYGINFIQRTLESNNAEEGATTVHNYLQKLNEPYVCLLNPCCPLITSKTVDDAINLFVTTKIKSLFSVKKSYELIFKDNEKLINEDLTMSSKLRKPHLIGNNAIYIFDQRILFKTGSYWSYSANDPHLYIMDDLESIDIDTELDFKIAQFLYKNVKVGV